MNVNDKLQLIRALEEREVAARRTSGRVAWTSVLVAALVLFVMIGLARRELASLTGRIATARQEADNLERNLAGSRAQLATVKDEISAASNELDRAASDLQKGARGASAVEAARENLAAASYAAEAPARPVKPTTADGPPLPEAVDRKDAITRLFNKDPAVRVRAYGELLPRYADDPMLVDEILEIADTQQNQNNANGTYNALVVLSHMNAKALSRRRKDIIAFAERSQGIGPRVADRARTLIKRVPAG